ncbi:MAG: mechanosensitive ion channel [Clostridia bacterium]|nr:mechanosensitive ion channel [Clostridia bacterium]
MISMLSTTADTVTGWVDGALNTLLNWCLSTGVKILIALIILVVSFRIVTLIARKIAKKGNKDKYDKTVMKILSYLFNIGMKVVIAICLIGYLGIDTSGLTALVASFGVCIGLAVNGALSNVAGGVLIVVTRPFRIDDFIEAQGVSGTVEDIHMVCTKIRTGDNKIVYLPNGALANGNIINYSEKDTRRVDFSFSVGYGEDFEQAKTVVLDLLNAHELTLKDPAPMARVSEHGANGITITARAWVKSGDYWTVNFDILEAVKKAFDEKGIEIPFSQLDVHVKKD